MCTGRGWNQGPLGPKSDALTTAPLRHLFVYFAGYNETPLQCGYTYILMVFLVMSPPQAKEGWGACFFGVDHVSVFVPARIASFPDVIFLTNGQYFD